jgi:hypothetical protein
MNGLVETWYEMNLRDVYYEGSIKRWNKAFHPTDHDLELIQSGKLRIHCQDGVISGASVSVTPEPIVTLKPTDTPTSEETSKPAVTAKPSTKPSATGKPAAEDVELFGQICGTGFSLKGKIGVNVLIGFADMKAVEAADLSVIVNVDGKEKVQKLSDYDHYTSGKKEIYEIQSYVSAKQINDKITLKLSDGKGKDLELQYGKKVLTSFAFSIGEITKSYLENSEQHGEKIIDLVMAIRNYCGYTQLMTGYKIDEAQITDMLLYINARDLQPYASVVDNNSKIAKYTGLGLTLQSDTAMQIYFNLTDKVDDYTFAVDGEKVTPESLGGNQYCIELKSISAGRLSTTSVIEICKGSEKFSIRASALSWAESVISNSKGQKIEAVNMAKMLYRYSQKADIYFGRK